MLCLSFNWCNRRHSRCGSHGDHLELIGISFPLCSLSLSHCSLSRCTRLIWVMYIRLIVPSSLSGIITSSTWHDLRWDERASIDRLVLCLVFCYLFFFFAFCFLFLVFFLFFFGLLNNFSCFHTTFTYECDVWRLLSSQPPSPPTPPARPSLRLAVGTPNDSSCPRLNVSATSVITTYVADLLFPMCLTFSADLFVASLAILW